MYQRIIVPLDGSDLAATAVPAAVVVANHFDAEILLLATGIEEEHGYLRDYLASVADDLTASTRDPLVLPAGRPAVAIANEGQAADALVVMTSHGDSGLRRAVLGSVAEEAIRRIGKPVLLVGPQFDPSWEPFGSHLVAPLDYTHKGEAILDAIPLWSVEFHMGVTVVHVDDDQEPAPESAYVTGVVERLRAHGVDAEAVVISGEDAAQRLASFAAELPAGLIAMTTRGHVGIVRLTLGSVTAEVINRATCPVLVTAGKH